jgi:hypothetical protein
MLPILILRRVDANDECQVCGIEQITCVWIR